MSRFAGTNYLLKNCDFDGDELCITTDRYLSDPLQQAIRSCSENKDVNVCTFLINVVECLRDNNELPPKDREMLNELIIKLRRATSTLIPSTIPRLGTVAFYHDEPELMVRLYLFLYTMIKLKIKKTEWLGPITACFSDYKEKILSYGQNDDIQFITFPDSMLQIKLEAVCRKYLDTLSRKIVPSSSLKIHAEIVNIYNLISTFGDFSIPKDDLRLGVVVRLIENFGSSSDDDHKTEILQLIHRYFNTFNKFREMRSQCEFGYTVSDFHKKCLFSVINATNKDTSQSLHAHILYFANLIFPNKKIDWSPHSYEPSDSRIHLLNLLILKLQDVDDVEKQQIIDIMISYLQSF